MEIYRQTTNIVEFEAPAAATNVTATASFNNGTPVNLTVTGNTGTPTKEKTATLPYLPYEGLVKVEWSFPVTTFNGLETVVVLDTYDVVSPLLTNAEIKEIHPNATPDEIERIEKAVRHIIQAHTGQRFGKFVGIYDVKGSGTRALQLPARLIELEEVNGTDAANNFTVTAGGWVLNYFPWGVPPVKADYFELHQHHGGVIHNPNNVRLGNWVTTQTFAIDGVWGWEEIPQPVKEAAKLLVNDYACADQSYRDRYLTSMTAADWRIQFHDGAFGRTGNVRADQLLREYVLKRGWAVI